jgi:hypothetical protein
VPVRLHHPRARYLASAISDVRTRFPTSTARRFHLDDDPKLVVYGVNVVPHSGSPLVAEQDRKRDAIVFGLAALDSVAESFGSGTSSVAGSMRSLSRFGSP